MKNNKKLISIGVSVLVLLGAGIFGREELLDLLPQNQEVTQQAPSSQTSSNGLQDPSTFYQNNSAQINTLAQMDFKSGDNAIYQVDGGKSTLDPDAWSTNKVIYGDLDSLNRTTFVTAFIDQKNLGKSEGRDQQVFKPTGWHQKKVGNDYIYNRGHLLAYTSSFNLDIDGNYKQGETGSIDNPKNLATQSAFSNQILQTHYEKLVRDAQKIKDNKVTYEIITVFRDQELMPRGYWLQAVDTNKTLNFNVYLFNVQPDVQFNYQDGTSKIDRSFKAEYSFE
ncbi:MULTISPECIES: DNA/RNA non-specific endonuclease [Enterococcus]|uniref:DNA/RNA non-specific endonuclease/pyrophosphatase/phosphodiesterase domain-containing protein n=1 Tax=Enterococcus sulfureus ATCC 49903 TaxID=1140003 RepID=S0NR78_9ENTE|nr:DNA/RNA non-specific endonuclease [Enterococcus sulfureus]EOT47765.1 hypothetical protein OMY_01139 [Enterococcus sulfureus ATCC 49903]EOT83814.1 hypothetical protein I573_01539 [Enterococcus sulfureus ATCC 49903]